MAFGYAVHVTFVNLRSEVVPWNVVLTSAEEPHATSVVGLSEKTTRFTCAEFAANSLVDGFFREDGAVLDHVLEPPEENARRSLRVLLAEKFPRRDGRKPAYAAVDRKTYDYLRRVVANRDDDVVLLPETSRSSGEKLTSAAVVVRRREESCEVFGGRGEEGGGGGADDDDDDDGDGRYHDCEGYEGYDHDDAAAAAVPARKRAAIARGTFDSSFSFQFGFQTVLRRSSTACETRSMSVREVRDVSVGGDRTSYYDVFFSFFRALFGPRSIK